MDSTRLGNGKMLNSREVAFRNFVKNWLDRFGEFPCDNRTVYQTWLTVYEKKEDISKLMEEYDNNVFAKEIEIVFGIKD
jgi:hypothetical protein